MIANTLQLQQSKILCKFNYCHDFINKYVLLFGININKLIALLHISLSIFINVIDI